MPSSKYLLLNISLLVMHVSLTLWALLLAPLVDVSLAWTAPVVALFSNSFWALQHEALHGLFSRSVALNRRSGRLMAILFGSSYRLLRFGHLMHHRYNRHPLDRPDIYDPARKSPFRAHLEFYASILGGFYFIEVLLPLLFWLPKQVLDKLIATIYSGDDERLRQIRRLGEQGLLADRAIREIRVDALAALALLGGAFWVWGENWLYLLIFLGLRGFLISFLDNIYHFRTPVDRPEYAYNLELPTPLRWMVLNMNLHQVHHDATHVPWWQLPGRFRTEGHSYWGSYAAAAAAQLRGPAPLYRLASR